MSPPGSRPGTRPPERESTPRAARLAGASNPDTRPQKGGGTPSEGGGRRAVYRDEPIYETLTRAVVDREARTERKRSGFKIVFSDEFVTSDHDVAMRHRAEVAEQGGSVSYSVQDTYADINHPAVTHTESCQVQVGTRRVIDHYE